MKFDALLFICNHVIGKLPIALVRRLFYCNIMGFSIEKDANVFMSAWFECRNHLAIGARSVVNRRCTLDNRGGITIGSDVLLSPEVMIITADHDVQTQDCRGRNRPVVIGNRVFVGSRATILPGVTVGEGAVICASALVTKDVASFTIVGGVPARVIGDRTKDLSYTTKYKRWFH